MLSWYLCDTLDHIACPVQDLEPRIAQCCVAFCSFAQGSQQGHMGPEGWLLYCGLQKLLATTGAREDLWDLCLGCRIFRSFHTTTSAVCVAFDQGDPLPPTRSTPRNPRSQTPEVTDDGAVSASRAAAETEPT